VPVVGLVRVGVLGGSGLYSFLDDVEMVSLTTPFGAPSGPIAIGELVTSNGPCRIAFLPRHGSHHELPPHRINYRANLWAFRELGVERILAPCASGSLQPAIAPGDFVVCDQFVDRTWGRPDTFFDGPEVNHVSLADPYCTQLRAAVAGAAHGLDLTLHRRGTVVVVQGPRFSTRAESCWFRDAGWHVINMTQYPEVTLARELGMCYAAVAMVTDYDAGVEGMPDVHPVTQAEVFEFFAANLPKVRRLLEATIQSLPPTRSCTCADATNGIEPVPAANDMART
jgi:5'-methylthioadenosine phosphorylase